MILQFKYLLWFIIIYYHLKSKTQPGNIRFKLLSSGISSLVNFHKSLTSVPSDNLKLLSFNWVKKSWPSSSNADALELGSYLIIDLINSTASFGVSSLNTLENVNGLMSGNL